MKSWIATLAAAALLLGGVSASAAPKSKAKAGPDPSAPAAMQAERDVNPAAPRHEGEGPYPRLVIRGATLIDGTGAPPYGPVDIVVENNRIAEIRTAGTPGLPLKPGREPRQFDREIDATGMYVLPGFIDGHAHGGDPEKAPDLEYVYKLWLAHGVTTVRSVPLASQAVAVSEKGRSARNEITAPRIFNYQTLGAGWGRVDSPEKARQWVRWAAANGIDGIKFFINGDETPEIDRAALDEAKKLGMGSVAHLGQLGVAQFNARTATEAGLRTVTHFYGHFESLLKDGRVQPFPSDYNYFNEQDRFGHMADIWDKIYEPGSPEWWAYLEELKSRGVELNPTFGIYSASRDLMRAKNADWHKVYTLPSLLAYYDSNRDNHGSYFYDWTTQEEVQWRHFFQRFMQLVGDYQSIGGRVTAGSDSGFIWQLYGFGYILELEMLQEAGLTPLEVVQAATFNGAQALYEPKGLQPEIGSVKRGMLADLVITPENPLANFKTLYGTGHERLNPATNRQERVGGVRWTIKDGIVYDAPALLADVRGMVEAQRRARGGQ